MDGSGGGVHMMGVKEKKDTWTNLVRFQNSYRSLATAPESLLVFVNTNREIHKCTDIVVAFTHEYFKVSYLSTGKQWLKKLIVNHHVSTNQYADYTNVGVSDKDRSFGIMTQIGELHGKIKEQPS